MSVTCADDVPALTMIDAKGTGATLPVMVPLLKPNETPFEFANVTADNASLLSPALKLMLAEAARRADSAQSALNAQTWG